MENKILKRRHHTLPKNCFLKPFSTIRSQDPDDVCIWVHSFDEAPRYTNLDNVSVVKHFYTFYDEDGKKNAQLEDFLESVEVKLAPTIHKLIQQCGDANFSIEEKANIATFVGMMIVRTPQYRMLLQNVLRTYKKAWEEFAKGNDPMNIVRTASNASRRQLGFNSVNREMASAFFANPKIMKNAHVLSLWRQSELNAKILFEQMQWSFILAKTGLEFVTCDDPVGRFNEQMKKTMQGIANKSVCIYFPISPEICFYANHDRSSPARRDWPSVCIEGKKDEVELVNHRMMSCAHREVYSRSEDPGISKIMLESDPKPPIS